MRLLATIFFGLFMSGCSTFEKAFDKILAKPETLAKVHAEEPLSPAKYSDNPQMSVPANRHYKRTTRQRLEEESELHAQAGSMWVPEGQSAYLFAQNKARREGDLLNVRLDGPAIKQVETKVNVIKKLLKQLEDELQQKENEQRLAANQQKSAASGSRTPAALADANSVTPNGNANAEGSQKDQETKSKKDDKSELAEVQNIQTRIVEKLPDGNYRVKGNQPFMIDKKEYKVIVTGVIRPEDFSDEGVSSAKLIESQIDVVSIRRNGRSE